MKVRVEKDELYLPVMLDPGECRFIHFEEDDLVEVPDDQVRSYMQAYDAFMKESWALQKYLSPQD